MVIHGKITDRALNTVNAMLFGDNADWRGNGFGIWNTELGALDPKVVSAFRESGITTLRYPGGSNASYFHWKETIGKDRLPQIDAFSKEWPVRRDKQGEKYIAHFGFEEFISLCSQTGILPSIILNAGNGTQIDSEVFHSDAVGLMPAMKQVPVGDIAAYQNDSGVLTLMLINRDFSASHPFEVELSGQYRVCAIYAASLRMIIVPRTDVWQRSH